MYALVLLLAMALTGLTWSFSWYRAGFYKVFGVEMKQRAGHGALQTVHGTPQTAHGTLQTAHGTPQTAHGGKSGRNSSEEGRGNREHTSPYACWQQVYEELKARNAGYKQITVFNGSASVSFERFGNQRAADRYAFNPQDGEITEVTLYKDTDASGKMLRLDILRTCGQLGRHVHPDIDVHCRTIGRHTSADGLLSVAAAYPLDIN